MIKMTIQDAEETAEFKVLEKPIIQKPLIAESDVVTIDNNLSTYVTGTQKRELTVGLGFLDSVGYETLRRIRDRQYAVLKYPTVTITADEPVDLGYGEDVPDYRQKIVNLGKNLFDKDNASIFSGYIASNNTLTSAENYQTAYLPCSPNTTYTVSKNAPSPMRVAYSNTATIVAGGATAGYARVTTTPSQVITITTGNNAKMLLVTFKEQGYVIGDNMNTLQVEKGSNATSYAPYFTPIELCKIGDYQDYIYKSDEKWMLHKATGKYVYNNDLINNGIGSTYVAMLTPTLPTLPNMSFTDGLFWCNSYTPVMQNNTGIQGTNGASRIRLNTSLDIADSYDGVKALAAANNLTIYYPLVTPTDTEITNETLKAQLDALQNSAFDRWTKIETEVQESLQPYLTVTQGDITGSGKEMMLEGTTEDLLDFVILGDTTEQTYSGKNRLAFSNGSYTSNGVTTIWENGKAVLSNKATSSQVFVTDYCVNNLSAGTYTFSLDRPSPRRFIFRTFDANNATIASFNIESNQKSVQVTISGTEAKYRIVMLATNGQVYNETDYFQLEPGSTATNWEQYVGGTASPNPIYPQAVQTVGGNIDFDFYGPEGIRKYTMVGKMTLADQRIIDNCGTNEQVQVSFRESKQI